MSRIYLYTIGLLFLWSCSGNPATPTDLRYDDWKGEAEKLRMELIECVPDDNQNCKQYTALMIKAVYELNDFVSEDQPMTPKQIAEYVFDSNDWKFLGDATDQSVLSKAQDLANMGQAVIVIDHPFKHVAIIMEGDLQTSGSWGLDVPMAISLFSHQPGASFIGKSLAYSWSNPENLEVYTRKY